MAPRAPVAKTLETPAIAAQSTEHEPADMRIAQASMVNYLVENMAAPGSVLPRHPKDWEQKSKREKDIEGLRQQFGFMRIRAGYATLPAVYRQVLEQMMGRRLPPSMRTAHSAKILSDDHTAALGVFIHFIQEGTILHVHVAPSSDQA